MDKCETCRYNTNDYVCHPHCSGCDGKSKYIPRVDYIHVNDLDDAKRLFSASVKSGRDIIVNDNNGYLRWFFKKAFPNCSYEVIPLFGNLLNEDNESVFIHDLLEILQPRYRPFYERKIVFIVNANKEFCKKCYKIYCEDLEGKRYENN